MVVAEAKGRATTTLVRHDVAERVREVVGRPAQGIVLVQPGTLPKTCSGKLQRSLCRSRYHDERRPTLRRR